MPTSYTYDGFVVTTNVEFLQHHTSNPVKKHNEVNITVKFWLRRLSKLRGHKKQPHCPSKCPHNYGSSTTRTLRDEVAQ